MKRLAIGILETAADLAAICNLKDHIACLSDGIQYGAGGIYHFRSAPFARQSSY